MNPQIVPQALRSFSHMFSGLRDPTMLGNQSSSASICITAAAIVWWLLFAYCVATSIGGWFRGAIDCLNHHSHHFVMSSSVVKSIKNFFSNNNHDLIPVHVTTSNNATADSNTNATGSTSTTADSAFNGTNRRYWRKRGATRKRKLEEPCKKLFCTRQASKRGLCQVCFPKKCPFCKKRAPGNSKNFQCTRCYNDRRAQKIN